MNLISQIVRSSLFRSLARVTKLAMPHLSFTSVWIRKCVTVSMALVSALLIFVLCALPFMYVGQMMSERSLNTYMGRAVDRVIKFHDQQGRLPSGPELAEIAGDVAKGERIELFTLRDDAQLLEQFGPPPPDGFILSFWRGEWTEGMASWTRASTINTSWVDVAFGFLGIALIFAFGAFSFGMLAWIVRPHRVSAALQSSE